METEYLNWAKLDLVLRTGPITPADVRRISATVARARDANSSVDRVVGYMRPEAPIIYLSGVYTSELGVHLGRPDIGLLATPATAQYIGKTDTRIAFDNGCFAAWKKHERFDFNGWARSLKRVRPEQTLFVTVPDVVSDAEATLELGNTWVPFVRDLGLRAAYVAQNGATVENFPWHHVDALFIGGDTKWKLGPEAAAIAREASDRGHWVHMGRVNSLQRLQCAVAMGCDSADGTYLAFGPSRNLPLLLGWLDRLSADRDPMFEVRPSEINGASIVSARSPTRLRQPPVESRDGATLF